MTLDTKCSVIPDSARTLLAMPTPTPAPRSVVKLADAEIQTHHVKNAGEACTWDESVRAAGQ